jgi:alcohol dehydrogenase YqhD (iron-dependent ADH family)
MINDFVYYTPTKVFFGKSKEKEIGKIIKTYGFKKVLIHYGGDHIVKSGLLDTVIKALDEEGIAHVELGGVVPNPRLSLVYKGIELAKKEKIDFILAIGGGSVIDSSKAIGYGVYNGGDVWDFYNFKRKPQGSLPLGVILTIAASGSEMSDSSVITNEDGRIKRGCNSEYCRAKFAVLNPELTYTLSRYESMCGCADILMHTMERYFNASDDMDITDELSEGLMRAVIKNTLIIFKDLTNYKARAELMWAGSLSHNGLMGCGTDGGDWATHKIEHELSGKYDVTHGAGLTSIWGSWARYVYKNRPERFAKFANKVFGLNDENQDKLAIEGIEAMEKFYRSVELPTNLNELGVKASDSDIEDMASRCSLATNNKTGKVKVLTKEDIVNIYKMARKGY